ncbi:MAG: 30S ribosome-binding factor RbfA [Elusimicrobia bacterium]|nr:30S ribosome-binding factor RbfA [Elusimicrobiota bacterium]
MFDRNERLSSLFLSEVNFVLRDKHELKSDGLFTVTGVEISDEGKALKVYFSVFGSSKTEEENLKIIESFSREIKNSMRKRLKLKIIPNISFCFDSTPQRAGRIEEILRKINSEKENEKPETP